VFIDESFIHSFIIAPLAVVVVARTVMSSKARASPFAARFNRAMTSECETSRPVVIRDAR